MPTPYIVVQTRIPIEQPDPSPEKRIQRAWANPATAKVRAMEILGPRRVWFLQQACKAFRLGAEVVRHERHQAKMGKVIKRALQVLLDLERMEAGDPEIAAQLDQSPQQAEARFWEHADQAVVELKKAARANEGFEGSTGWNWRTLDVVSGISPEHVPRGDHLRKAILARALDDSALHGDDGCGSAHDYTADGLAYFAIAVELDKPPRAKTRGDEESSAAHVFDADSVARWRRLLRACRQTGGT